MREERRMDFPFEALANCVLSIVTKNEVYIRLRITPSSTQDEEEHYQPPALYCQVLTISQGEDFQPGSMMTLTVVDSEMIDHVTLMGLNDIPPDVVMTSIGTNSLC